MINDLIEDYINARMSILWQIWETAFEEAIDFGFADGILGQKNYEDLNTIRSV